MLVAAQFITAKTENKTTQMSFDGRWIIALWYILTMGHHSATKRNKY